MMRGFLNRVRRASSGSNLTNDTPPTAAATSSTNSTSPAPPPPHPPHEMKDNSEITSPSSSSKERSNSSKGIESTPKADVALPKKNKRSLLLLLFKIFFYLPSSPLAAHLSIEVRKCMLSKISHSSPTLQHKRERYTSPPPPLFHSPSLCEGVIQTKTSTLLCNL
jgi:hypothetical protein